MYIRTLFEHPIESFSLTDEAIAGSEVANSIGARIAATTARGGRVYFLGLVDLTPEEWDLFYGSRLHLPFELLNPYRKGAIAIERLPGLTPESLYEFKNSGP